jgi:hypothetical protein
MDTPKNNNCQIYKIKDCNKRKMFLKQQTVLLSIISRFLVPNKTTWFYHGQAAEEVQLTREFSGIV